MIRLSFERIMLAIVWRKNKKNTSGNKETSLEAAAVIQQRNVCRLGQGGTRGEQGLDSKIQEQQNYLMDCIRGLKKRGSGYVQGFRLSRCG